MTTNENQKTMLVEIDIDTVRLLLTLTGWISNIRRGYCLSRNVLGNYLGRVHVTRVCMQCAHKGFGTNSHTFSVCMTYAIILSSKLNVPAYQYAALACIDHDSYYIIQVTCDVTSATNGGRYMYNKLYIHLGDRSRVTQRFRPRFVF